MKKTIVFILGIFFCLSLAKADTITPKDTIQLSAFQLDKKALEEVQKDEKYNYRQEKIPVDSWWSKFKRAIYLWILRNSNVDLKENQIGPFLAVSSILILLLVGVLLYIYKPKLFYLEKKGNLSYSLSEEDLGEINYKQRIAEAINQGAFSEAIRWEYLHLLNELHACGIISYDSNRTVNEYIYEIKERSLRDLFRDLSSGFLYYRYGYGMADYQVFDSFQQKCDRLINTIERT